MEAIWTSAAVTYLWFLSEHAWTVILNIMCSKLYVDMRRKAAIHIRIHMQVGEVFATLPRAHYEWADL